MKKTDLDQPKNESILGEKKVVINIGLKVFEESLLQQGAEVVTVNWNPPTQKQAEINSILDEIL